MVVNGDLPVLGILQQTKKRIKNCINYTIFIL